MTKIFSYFLCAFFLLCSTLSTQNQSFDLLKKKEFEKIPSYFADDSFEELISLFKDHQAIALETISKNQIIYYVKFTDRAEIGLIIYEEEDTKIKKLEIKRLIKPLYYLDRFIHYQVKDVSIPLGEAVIHFQQGDIFSLESFPKLMIFAGTWRITVNPSDEEEQLTLQYLTRKNTFQMDRQVGIFLFADIDFLKNLTREGREKFPEIPLVKDMMAFFANEFAIQVAPFKEPWFLSFAPELNVAIFQNHKKSYFQYFFNPAGSPDTMLVAEPESQYYLSYNANRNLKLSASSEDKIDNIKLNLFYNPDQNFLSATTILNYNQATDIKKVTLNNELKIRAVRDITDKPVSFTQRQNVYYIMGNQMKDLSLYYSGKFNSDKRTISPSFHHTSILWKKPIDFFYIIGRQQNFFPKPDNKFFTATMSISLPSPTNCLAPGELIEQKEISERNIFTFRINNTSDLAMAFGPFEKIQSLAGPIPIHVYGSKNFPLNYYFAKGDIEKYTDFLFKKLGILNAPQINILFRRWHDFGGLSQAGLIIFNIPDISTPITETTSRYITSDSPVVFSADMNRDNFIHELSHQWWGETISWDSFRDIWILEGGAHFSSLLYYESITDKEEFLNCLEKRVKNWVFRFQNTGPLIYGRRIANLIEKQAQYQSIIYNKSALVFFMLREIMGEQAFYDKLQNLFKTYEHQKVSSQQFIQFFSQGNPQLEKFLHGWVYSRKLPVIKYKTDINGHRLNINFQQENRDFVIPLRLAIYTNNNQVIYRSLIINAPEQSFQFSETDPIKSIKVLTDYSPVIIEK